MFEHCVDTLLIVHFKAMEEYNFAWLLRIINESLDFHATAGPTMNICETFVFTNELFDFCLFTNEQGRLARRSKSELLGRVSFALIGKYLLKRYRRKDQEDQFIYAFGKDSKKLYSTHGFENEH
jgi:hypothetical protein